ncbi:hypothetical protein IE077_004321 [Cardiosporidium cionae]|uniref:Uncharacterized protein n=1 Tax=Cardiosporidium cionae TaxID=476202 RepID=A0ABQ7J4W2_9APIC|nr:hypothetical protein IE077_004321 [Cardiosporidium cionae]|eukprot:KAF8819013.1 hypothetical protein IE077_004321 [Cardiosporidium cionae]
MPIGKGLQLTLSDICKPQYTNDVASESLNTEYRHIFPAGKRDTTSNIIKLQVNRLMLLSPFTSTQDMAKRMTQEKIGTLLSKALSGFVSSSIEWNNIAEIQKSFFNIKALQEAVPPVQTFQNLRIYVQHGEKDTLIPWSMGRDLANEMSRLSKTLRLNIPVKVSSSL